MKIATIQSNPVPGDFEGNADRLIADYAHACARGAELVVGNELHLWGYYPHDMLLDTQCRDAHDRAFARVCAHVGDTALVVGVSRRARGGGEKDLYNSVACVRNGVVEHVHDKCLLPTYLLFHERRHFRPGSRPVRCFEYRGRRIGLAVCEDIWYDATGGAYGENPLEPFRRANGGGDGLDILIVINASPYYRGKRDERMKIIRSLFSSYRIGRVVYANRTGGQDEIVFDGSNVDMDARGNIMSLGTPFCEGVFGPAGPEDGAARSDWPRCESDAADVSMLYRALVVGTRDYVRRNGYGKIVLGLSGGIDSALTLAIAADALGAENCHAVMMPFDYTSPDSIRGARRQAETMGVPFDIIDIGGVYASLVKALAPVFGGAKTDITEENLQARIRGIILMAISNKQGKMVLSTGNKSETAVGYATLYGDMVGGFDVLKDVPKTTVYELAEYRNSITRCIPRFVMTRPPSAELAPNQRDSDSLPPYDVLDAVLFQYIDMAKSAEETVAACAQNGISAEDVRDVIGLVEKNEYKRRQAPPGVLVSKRGLSPEGGRVYPITKCFPKTR